MQPARSPICLAASLAALALSCGGALSLRLEAKDGEGASRNNSVPVPQAGLARVANDDWTDRLRSEEFWRRMPSSRAEAPSRPTPRSEGAATSSRPAAGSGYESRWLERGGSYRTVCVRLCDGYFWPMSFAAARGGIEQDRRKCEQSCESPARLFISRGLDGEVEDMKDENGRYYRDLETAFVYRSAYIESCKCRAHPWEAEAQARHARYATQAKSPSAQRQAIGQ